MAISVSQAFKRTSANPIDETLALTKAQMLSINDNLMPSKYLTVCQDDGLVYLYDKSATPNATTGKFKKFEGGSGHKVVDTDGTTVADEDKLQFIGLDVKDNSTDDETEVESFGLNSDSLDDVTDGAIQPSYASGIKYSTDEQVIGQWIDGKPLYQKTFIFTPTGVSSSNPDFFVNLGVSADIAFVKDGFIAFPSGNRISFPSYTGSNIMIMRVDIFNNSHVTYPNTIKIANAYAWDSNSCDYWSLTIQYTKTTD